MWDVSIAISPGKRARGFGRLAHAPGDPLDVGPVGGCSGARIAWSLWPASHESVPGCPARESRGRRAVPNQEPQPGCLARESPGRGAVPNHEPHPGCLARESPGRRAAPNQDPHPGCPACESPGEKSRTKSGTTPRVNFARIAGTRCPRLEPNRMALRRSSGRDGFIAPCGSGGAGILPRA